MGINGLLTLISFPNKFKLKSMVAQLNTNKCEARFIKVAHNYHQHIKSTILRHYLLINEQQSLRLTLILKLVEKGGVDDGQ